MRKFQSTHPGWGATCRAASTRSASRNFNPRTPGGVRRRMALPIQPPYGISIHAPGVGCDAAVGDGVVRPFGISIHAPRVGCDRLSVGDGRRLADFNPRTPGGVRPDIRLRLVDVH